MHGLETLKRLNAQAQIDYASKSNVPIAVWQEDIDIALTGKEAVINHMPYVGNADLTALGFKRTEDKYCVRGNAPHYPIKPGSIASSYSQNTILNDMKPGYYAITRITKNYLVLRRFEKVKRVLFESDYFKNIMLGYDLYSELLEK